MGGTCRKENPFGCSPGWNFCFKRTLSSKYSFQKRNLDLKKQKTPPSGRIPYRVIKQVADPISMSRYIKMIPSRKYCHWQNRFITYNRTVFTPSFHSLQYADNSSVISHDYPIPRGWLIPCTVSGGSNGLDEGQCCWLCLPVF